jgi:hypothetical protein
MTQLVKLGPPPNSFVSLGAHDLFTNLQTFVRDHDRPMKQSCWVGGPYFTNCVILLGTGSIYTNLLGTLSEEFREYICARTQRSATRCCFPDHVKPNGSWRQQDRPNTVKQPNRQTWFRPLLFRINSVCTYISVPSYVVAVCGMQLAICRKPYAVCRTPYAVRRMP